MLACFCIKPTQHPSNPQHICSRLKADSYDLCTERDVCMMFVVLLLEVNGINDAK